MRNLKKENEYKRIQRQERINQGLCIECGKNQPIANTRKCEACTQRYKELRSKRYMKDKSLGLCTSCGEPSDKVYCKNCMHRVMKYVKKREEGLRRKGLSVCETCYFKKLSTKHLGTTKKWKLLKDKLISQNYCCAYSGIKIEVGNNASVDHIIAKSKGGTDSIENLQWVHIWINRMKSNFSNDVFLNFCELVAKQKKASPD